MNASTTLVPFLALAVLSCAHRRAEEAAAVEREAARAGTSARPEPPLAGAQPVDHLIQPGEEHLVHLWQVTRGGENAEGYWNFANDRLSLQRRFGEAKCDRIFVTDPSGADPTGNGPLIQVSDGKGVTTCSYFMPGDLSVIFASTQAVQTDCPPSPDYSKGYVWALRPEFDLWVHALASGKETRLTDTPGYDAEATVSPLGDRIVFTSTRTGDPELWTCDLKGRSLVQVTHTSGYDGGAFYSHDGKRLVFRSTVFAPDGEPGDRAEFAELIQQHLIRPTRLELQVCDADGANRRQITDLGGANFAPYFFPDDRRVIFSSNHAEPRSRNFDLFAIGLDGGHPERITTYEGFDSFPMFTRDGRYLVFASNRGGTAQGETNLFIAQWK